MSERSRLPNRRRAVRQGIVWVNPRGAELPFDAGFGLDAENAIREVFCIPREPDTNRALKTGSELKGIIDDACIAISLALQFGARMADLAMSFGELRPERETSGPPASPIGAIARAGVQVEADIANGLLKVDPVVAGGST